MSLFDQQPMGPLPARRPRIVPEDPALAELGIDPTGVPIRVVDPAPRELRHPTPSTPRRHWFRMIVAFLLLLPTAGGLVTGILHLTGVWGTGEAESLIDSEARMASLFAVCLVLAVIAAAYAIFRRSAHD